MACPPLVSVILLNWENFPDTSDCIESLKNDGYENLNIIVVDNGSTDGSREKIENKYDDITLIKNKDNIGFPAGNNVGIEEGLRVESKYIFILNNDTILQEGSDIIKNLVKIHEDKPNVGAISPLIMSYYNKNKIWFAKGVIDPLRGEFRHKYAGEELENYSLPSLITNEWISGCAMLVKSEVFGEIGKMNEKYFITTSDVEFSFRIRKSGYRLLTDTQTRIFHKESASQSKQFQLSYYLSRNRKLLIDNQELTPYRVMRYTYYIWFIKAIFHRGINGSWGAIQDLIRGRIDLPHVKKSGNN